MSHSQIAEAIGKVGRTSPASRKWADGAHAVSTAVIVANRAFAIANSRLQLIEQLVGRGYRVVVTTSPDHHVARLEEAGAILEPIVFHRGGLSVSKDTRSLFRLLRVYRWYRPVLVHHFNAKPVLLGTAAARIACRARVVNTITGLGHAFIVNSAMRPVVSAAYRLLIGHGDATVFQNQDDLQFFVEKRWVQSEHARLIVSSGIDTRRYRPIRTNAAASPSRRVLMVGRLIWQKGVREYVEVARNLRARFPDVRFQLAGEWDTAHPDAVDRRFVEDAVASGVIDFLGFRTDLERLLPEITVFVLPSYREGTARVMLEAASCGVPVVGFDVPGSREAVRNGETGYLVPLREPQPLTEAVANLLGDEALRERFGRTGRAFVERHFDIRAVTAAHMQLYRELGLVV